MNSIADLLVQAAHRYGAKPFLKCVDRTLTFEESDRLAGLVAQNLIKRGLQPGDAITLWIENGWRWVVAYYGALRIGAVVNPVNASAASAAFRVRLREGFPGGAGRFTPATVSLLPPLPGTLSHPRLFFHDHFSLYPAGSGTNPRARSLH